MYLANVIIIAKYRNKGYGTLGLEMLCNAAKEHHIRYLYDNIAIDNQGISIFLKLGFVIESRNVEEILLKKKYRPVLDGII